LEEAVLAYENAIRINPSMADIYDNLGGALKQLGQLEDAINSYDDAIKADPFFAEAYNNRGNTLHSLGRFNEAVNSYQNAIKIKPNYAEAYSNLGFTQKCLGRHEEAVNNCNQAIELTPNLAEAYSNRGHALQGLNQSEAALSSFLRSIKLKPNKAELHKSLADWFLDMGRLEEAVNSYEKAINLKSDYSEAFNSRNCLLNYISDLTPVEIFNKHLEFEEQFGERILESKQQVTLNKDSLRRMRVAYISPDFRAHSVAYFFEPLLMSHDKNLVEVFCYYNDSVEDDTTERLRNRADHWRSIVGMNDKAVVKLIKKDNIDILVDLTGHTAKNRLTVFTYKPAPIQVTWLGYPNTTGLSAMDYRLTDGISDPVGEVDELYSEKLVRLPNGFLCYQGDESIPFGKTMPCLERGYITFGCFNNLNKVTPEVIKLWAKILLSVPHSHLLLKSRQFVCQKTKSRYLEMLRHEGITDDRIELHARTPKKEDHLSQYSAVDIGLDPFPYNGTTTTCEALWMGVPVISMYGDRHASRVGASILTHVGLVEFIARNTDDYVNKAIENAHNVEPLEVLRCNLRSQLLSSPLCDDVLFAGNIEKAYQQMLNQGE
jgi:predicted O-linked N-acetylglucosamine transferase (SPINDLY family)